MRDRRSNTLRLWLACLTACYVCSVQTASAHGELSIDVDDAGAQISVNGVDPHLLNSLSQADRADGSAFFFVTVSGRQRPLLGQIQLSDDGLRFSPRFPLRRGLAYEVVIDPAGEHGRSETAQRIQLTLPLAKPKSVASVRAIYPSSSRLPENLLKFYVHFSSPMNRGEAYQHLRLLDDEGQVVDLPFLEISQELWDPDGRRLTVLLDPGRIKQGLKPRLESGAVLSAGRQYTLEVLPGWNSDGNQPTDEVFRKVFTATPVDDTQPNPDRWEIRAPNAGTHQPLEVELDEPLDEAMLNRVITLRDARGKPVPGSVEVAEMETRWRFVPQSAWRTGDYRLLIATTLEDLAGNSVGRPFEVDVSSGAEQRNPDSSVERRVTIR